MQRNETHRAHAAGIAAKIAHATSGEVSGSTAEAFAALTVSNPDHAYMMIGGALSPLVLPALPADAGIDRLIVSLFGEGARFGAQFAASLFGDHADATIPWSSDPAEMLAHPQLQSGRPVACLVPQRVSLGEYVATLYDLAEFPVPANGAVLLLAGHTEFPLEAFNSVPSAVRARAIELFLDYTPDARTAYEALRDNSAIGRHVQALARAVGPQRLGALWEWKREEMRVADSPAFSSNVPGKVAVLKSALHLAQLALGIRIMPQIEEAIWLREYGVEEEVATYTHEALGDYIASHPDRFPEAGVSGCPSPEGMHLMHDRVCVRADLFPKIMDYLGYPYVEGYLRWWAENGKLGITKPPYQTRRTLPDGVTRPVYIVAFPDGLKRLPATGDGS